MKTQVSLIPEKLLDALTLIIVISVTFGMYILFAEYKLELKYEERIDIKLYNFAQVFIGDKCILYKNISKGVLDYSKVKRRENCIDIRRNVTIFVEGEKIIYNDNCENSPKKISIPVIIYKEGFKSGKVIVC